MKPFLLSAAVLIAALASSNARAQTFDASGNSLLTGNYFVRQILFSNLSNTGTIGRARSLSGTASFDGNGHYTLTGQSSDSTSNSGQAQTFNFNGLYAVN